MLRRKDLLKIVAVAMPALAILGCQKMERPALGNYPQDHVTTPSTPLRFFLSFDSTDAADQQINIRFKDSISGYPSFFPASSITFSGGVNGTAYSGPTDAYLNYINPNDFASTAESFTVAFWEKRDGAPSGNAAFVYNISSSNGNWANTSMFLLFDWSNPAVNDSAIIKMYLFDKDSHDAWLTWEGPNRVPGIQDNNWHHLAFVYDATTSKLTLYVDGVPNGHVPEWTGHGPVNLDGSKVAGFNVGGRNLVDLGWGQEWGGGLDQFRLYNTALTQAEVQALVTGKM